MKKDQAAYQTARNKFLQWLELTNEKLRSCSDPSGDLNALEDKISTIKVSCPVNCVQYKIHASILATEEISLSLMYKKQCLYTQETVCQSDN